MAALALMMAACSSEDSALENAAPAQQPGTMHFTATIAAPSGDATTRTAYTEVGTTINVKWEEGDHIALVHNGVVNVAEVTAVDGSGNATIEATITGNPSDNDDVTLAYPANAVFSATPYRTFHFTPNPDIFDKVKNYQDGTLAYIQNNLDLRTGDGKLAVSGDKVTLKESVSIPSLICIWKLTLQDESSNPLSATQLTFKNETYTQAKATSAAKNEYYLCVVPGYIPAPAGTYSFEATVGGDTYTFSKTDLNLTAGKYYKSTVKMAKAPVYTLLSAATAEDIGKVVCADGHLHTAKTAVPDGCTAVGILGKVTETGHGLILALQDATSQTWNTINGWTSVTKYAGTTLKQLPDDAALGANLTSFEKLGDTFVSNWAVAQKSDYEAIFENFGSTTGDKDGKTYDGNVNAYITTGVGGTAISGYYWSATVDGDVIAWGFQSSYWKVDYKANSHSVRPVLGF